MSKRESTSVCVSCLLLVLKRLVIIIIGTAVATFRPFELEPSTVGSAVLFTCVLDVVSA